MGQLATLRLRLGGTWFLLVTLVLWGMVWISLQSGTASIPGIINPDNPRHFIDGIRAVLPFVAAVVAAGIILYRFRIGQQDYRIFVSPLGLTAVYGLVGILSASLSADISISVYWSVLYLSVPLVLFAVSWRSDSVDFSSFIINLNWLAVILATVILLTLAMVRMNLADVVFNPESWGRCQYIGSWFADTGGKLRSTGVGRYAAIGAIVALSGLWNPRLRSIWAVFLCLSILLLLTTAARTAIVGFGGSALLVIFLYGGKKTAFAGVAVSIILVPVFWFTDAHNTFVDNCILNSGYLSGEDDATSAPDVGRIPVGFFTFSGRTVVWKAAWQRFKMSPLLGNGFHADRIMLGTHLHNTYLHSLLQTGVLGAIPFFAGILFGMVLFFKAIRRLNELSLAHKHLVIQSGGVLVFFAIRSIMESSGAFFGVDWLLLAPILLLLRAITESSPFRFENQ